MRRVLLLALLLCACGDDDAPPDAPRDAAGSDGRLEAAVDGAPVDEGTDAADGAPVDVAADTMDGATPPPSGRLFVTVGAESRVAEVIVDGDGTMREGADVDLGENPGAMAHSGDTLYVGVSGGIIELGLDLSRRGRTDIPARPVYLEVVGDAIISAYFNQRTALAHDRTSDAPYPLLDLLDTADEPHAAHYDGERIWIPHRNGQAIWTVRFDGAEFGEPIATRAPNGVGPRHVDFSPDGRLAYVVNEFDDSVSVLRVVNEQDRLVGDPETTLPADFDGDSNTCADIHVHPSGRFLYASNRGHDSIAILDIEGDAVRYRETVPTEARPREFELTPTGHLLFALGQGSGAIQSYRVEADGSLTPSSRLMLGDGLLWGIFIED
ncbi:MAG: beta-propeller fold lactonase family protein [Myxococcota bacterium]